MEAAAYEEERAASRAPRGTRRQTTPWSKESPETAFSYDDVAWSCRSRTYRHIADLKQHFTHIPFKKSLSHIHRKRKINSQMN